MVVAMARSSPLRAPQRAVAQFGGGGHQVGARGLVVGGVHHVDGEGAVGFAVGDEVIRGAVVQALGGGEGHLLQALHVGGHGEHGARRGELGVGEGHVLHGVQQRAAGAGGQFGHAAQRDHLAPVQHRVGRCGRGSLAFAHGEDVVVDRQVARVARGGEALHQVRQQVVGLQQLVDEALAAVALFVGGLHGAVGAVDQPQQGQVGHQGKQDGGQEATGQGTEFHEGCGRAARSGRARPQRYLPIVITISAARPAT